jgi:hypothetical protein
MNLYRTNLRKEQHLLNSTAPNMSTGCTSWTLEPNSALLLQQTYNAQSQWNILLEEFNPLQNLFQMTFLIFCRKTGFMYGVLNVAIWVV